MTLGMDTNVNKGDQTPQGIKLLLEIKLNDGRDYSIGAESDAPKFRRYMEWMKGFGVLVDGEFVPASEFAESRIIEAAN